MAAHFLLKARARDITLDDIELLTDADVRNMFLQARWGCTDKQSCPECGTLAAHYWKPTRKQWQCKADGCQRTFSLFSENKFTDHKLKPKKMLRMLFTFVTHAKPWWPPKFPPPMPNVLIPSRSGMPETGIWISPKAPKTRKTWRPPSGLSE